MYLLFKVIIVVRIKQTQTHAWFPKVSQAAQHIIYITAKLKAIKVIKVIRISLM